MTESAIHQLYCTHCTYATSFLHQRGDEAVGQQVFEYSTRSGSVARERSHDYFRQIEPYMYYHLPGDLPAADALKHDAQTTSEWRRLLYLPSVSGLRVLAHIAYRTTDTKGRPGSYFSHVLLSENENGSAPKWSAVDALRLWGSPSWVDTDRPDLPFQLSSLSRLDDLNGANQPAITDQLFHKFLTHPTSSTPPAEDTHRIVPPRFWQKTPEERQQLVSDTLTGFLGLNLERRQTVLLAVEPSLAALIFYGVARLLPRTGIGEKLSFSTFESDEDRPQTALAATTFYHPQTGRLPNEASQSRGVAINTFQSNGAEIDRSSPHADFAIKMVARLVQHGFDHTDQLIKELEDAKATETADLIEMQQVTELAEQALQSAETPAFQQRLRTLRSDRAMQALRARVGQKLVDAKSQSASAKQLPTPSSSAKANLQELTQQPSRALAIAHLLYRDVEAPEDVRKSIKVLLYRLVNSHPDKLPEVLGSTEIPLPVRLWILEQVIRKTEKIPSDCQELWSAPIDSAKYPLFVELLAHSRVDQGRKYLKLALKTPLSGDQVKPICEALATQETLKDSRLLFEFANYLLATPKSRQDKSNPLLKTLRTSRTFRMTFLGVYGMQCRPKSEDDISPLGESFAVWLDELPDDPKFENTLEVLSDAQVVLTDEARQRIEGWQGVRDTLHRIRDLQAKPNGMVEQVSHFVRKKQREQELDEFGRELSRHAEQAVPEDLFEGDDVSSDRANAVIKVCDHVLEPDGLPSEIKQKLERVFEGKNWDAQSTQPAERDPKRKTKSKPLGAWPPSPTTSAIAAAIVFIAVLAVIFNGDGPPQSNATITQKNPSPPKPSNNTAAPNPPRISETEDKTEPQNPEVDEQPTTSKQPNNTPKAQDKKSPEEVVVADSNLPSETDNETTNSETTKPESEKQTPPVTAESPDHVAASDEPGQESQLSAALQLTESNAEQLDEKNVYYATLPDVNNSKWMVLANIPEGQDLRELHFYESNRSLIEASPLHPKTSVEVSAKLSGPYSELDSKLCKFRWKEESNTIEFSWHDKYAVAAQRQYEQAVRSSILRVDCGDSHYISFLKPLKSSSYLQMAGQLPIRKPFIESTLPSVRNTPTEEERQSIEFPEPRDPPRIASLIQLPESEQSRIELLHDLYHSMHCINWTLRKSQLLEKNGTGATVPISKNLKKHTAVLRKVAETIGSPGALERDSRAYLELEWLLPSYNENMHRVVDTRQDPLVPWRDEIRLFPSEGDANSNLLRFKGKVLPGTRARYYVTHPDILKLGSAERQYELQLYNEKPLRLANLETASSPDKIGRMFCRIKVRFSQTLNDQNSELAEKCSKLNGILLKFTADINLISESGPGNLARLGPAYFPDHPEKSNLIWKIDPEKKEDDDLYTQVRDLTLKTADEIYQLIYEPYAEVVRRELSVAPQFSGTLYHVVGGEIQQGEQSLRVNGGIVVKAVVTP